MENTSASAKIPSTDESGSTKDYSSVNTSLESGEKVNNNDRQLLLEKLKVLEVTEEPLEYIFADSYRTSIPLQIIKWTLCICTFGLMGFGYLWSRRLNYLFERRCTPDEAEKFLIYTHNQVFVSCPVKEEKGVKYFWFNGLRYIFNGNQYVLLPNIEKTWTHTDILKMSDGLREDSVSTERRISEGRNIILVPVMSLVETIARQLLDPNFIYIYLCCLLWFLHHYEHFAAVIFTTSVVSGMYTAWETRQYRVHIRRMAKFKTEVNVYREGEWKQMLSDEIFPGDVVEVPPSGEKLFCDMVLISGSVLVDETSLTGESLPVVKLKLKENDKQYYDAEADKSHTLFSGTTIVGTVAGNSTSENLIGKTAAVVTRIGWKTAKGNLIRSILSVKPFRYRYETEAKIMYALLIVIGIGLFFVSLWLWGGYEEFDPENLLFGFEAIAILVPPMLPVLFHLGLITSSNILKNNYEVYTTDPSRIPLAGKIDIMCFDKTGTLTKDDLDMIGVLPIKKGRFTNFQKVDQTIPEKLMFSLATCHTLSKIDANLSAHVTNAQLLYSGPTVDIKMFQSTNWIYQDENEENKNHATVTSPDGKYSFQILKKFDFDPALQRMSAIVRHQQTKEIYIVCKGSPEVMHTVCKKNTVPNNYFPQSQTFSQNGCYVIGLGIKSLKLKMENLNSIKREDIEKEFNFVGLMCLRNELKSDTTDAIRQLKRGRIRNIMITGDNIYTAFYIGKSCGMVSENQECFIAEVEEGRVVYRGTYDNKKILDIETSKIIEADSETQVDLSKNVCIGVTTHAWDLLIQNEENHDLLINRVKIFARMKPLQKEAVVKLMSDSGRTVGMCGDGANDCAALSAAHCGIALSEAEASVVSPFTAKSLRITAVADTIREGRACLANAFALFKYTIFYGITQTSQCVTAYRYGADLSETMYVVIDFWFFLPTAYSLVRARATKRLKNDPPTARVFGPRTILSILGAVIIMQIAQEVILYVLATYSWYDISVLEDAAKYSIPEATVSWFVSGFAYLSYAIGCALGTEYRKPFYYNVVFNFMVTSALVFLNIGIWVFPEWDAGLYEFMKWVPLTFEVRIWVMVIGWVQFILILAWEKGIMIEFGNYMRDKYGRGRPQEPDFIPENVSNQSMELKTVERVDSSNSNSTEVK